MKDEKEKQVKQIKLNLELPLSARQKALVIGGMFATGITGFILGRKIEQRLLVIELAKMYIADPTFKDHVFETLSKMNSTK